MSLSILLCGEGKHDVGERVWSTRTKKYVYQDGWMQALVSRLMPSATLIPRPRRQLVVWPRNKAKYYPLPTGHGEKSLLAKLISAIEKIDVVIYMVDADSVDPKRWEAICREIHAGFEMLELKVRAIACVPMSASESWLLVDPTAWTAAGAKTIPDLPPHPETIWGARDDPESDHPHRHYARLCSQVEIDDNVVSRHTIAEQTDLDQLRAACSISFSAFADLLNEIE